MLFESSLVPVTNGGSCVDDIRRGETLPWHRAAVTHNTDGKSALLHFLPEVRTYRHGCSAHIRALSARVEASVRWTSL